MNSGPLHWDWGVLATGPPGKSHNLHALDRHLLKFQSHVGILCSSSIDRIGLDDLESELSWNSPNCEAGVTQMRNLSFWDFKGSAEASRHPAARCWHHCLARPFCCPPGHPGETEGGSHGGRPERRPPGTFGRLYHMPRALVALPVAWGNEGAPSHLVGDLASEGHPCSWKERHRLKSENAARDASSPQGA